MNTGFFGKRNVATHLVGFHPCDKSSAVTNEMYASSTSDSQCLQILDLCLAIYEQWRLQITPRVNLTK